jgi:predicted AAA+ superfamily ATPase
MLIQRTRHIQQLLDCLLEYPVVAILGARQVGKTTLSRQLVQHLSGPVTVFDLEDPRHLERLSDPMLELEPLEGIVVLDEIQLRPELFPVLRVLADRRPLPARFLVLGSASPDLLRQSSESLAGRIHYHRLDGLSLDEVGAEAVQVLWQRGGFPASYLARSDAWSVRWRRDFIQTFLQRDLPQLGIQIPSMTLWRFWSMIAHYHGQVWNGAELARAFGVGETTVRRYRDLLTSSLVLRQLQPWHENISKRQVRAPKVYLVDSGLLHTLLNVERMLDLEHHPKVGASWEGFAMQQVTAWLGVESEQCFFWATHAGAELDLLVMHGQRRLGFEFKRTSTPRRRKSMHVAIEDLGLERLDVIYPGQETFRMAEKIRAVGLSRLLVDVESLQNAPEPL